MRRHHLVRLLLLLTLVSLNACASRIPLRRTLPEWVETVYVPMFTNSSTQPGLEEQGTLAAVEEFNADGRLQATSKADADLVVMVNIINYTEEVDSFEDDEFPSVSRATVEASVRLYEPSNMNTPFADLDRIEATQSYVSDFRRTDYVPDVDARKEVMRNLARMVVERTITGYDLRAAQQAESLRDRNARRLTTPSQIRSKRGITITPEIPR